MGLPPYGPEPYASANSATPANWRLSLKARVNVTLESQHAQPLIRKNFELFSAGPRAEGQGRPSAPAGLALPDPVSSTFQRMRCAHGADLLLCPFARPHEFRLLGSNFHQVFCGYETCLAPTKSNGRVNASARPFVGASDRSARHREHPKDATLSSTRDGIGPGGHTPAVLNFVSRLRRSRIRAELSLDPTNF